MNSDPSLPRAGDAAPHAKRANAPPMGIREALRQVRKGIIVMWWSFFDWLAVISWKALLVVAFLAFILGGMLHYPALTFFLIVASMIIKVVAGGKRGAELAAKEATQRAETEQLERTVIEARMEALQAQIEPHFLFNTLGSIDQLITTDPPRASRMQQSLIRYLRSALPQMRDGSRPTLGQQVTLSEAYLEIMAMRMEERLHTVVRIPEGLKSAIFPSMMLQTLVENAIRHGLEPKATGGRLEIAAQIADGNLVVQVIDNGAGFAPTGGQGLGLANIRARFGALYGGRAELIISVPPEGGTCAAIAIPYEVPPPIA